MRVAVYVRQSVSLADGIERQRRLCADLVIARAWVLADEYIDNDVSASSVRGPNTAWHRLINDARAKRIDAVMAVDLDRLIRSQRDLLTLIDLGLKVVTVDGDIDLSTADGTFRATLATALARFEVQRKSERQRRATANNRARGLPAPGRRAFGYTLVGDGHQPLEPEAAAVRDAYKRIRQTTLGELAREWNARRLLNSRGSPWTPQAVRGVLGNPRYAAKIPLPGQSNPPRYDPLTFTDGSWEPLVTFEVWLSVRRHLQDATRLRLGTPVSKKLLIGSARCAICGGNVGSGNNAASGATYRCIASHFAIRASKVDEYVASEIVARLSTTTAKQRLSVRRDPIGELRLLQLGESRQRILHLVAEGSTTMREARAALSASSERIRELERSMVSAEVADVVLPVINSPAGVQDHWDSMTIEERRVLTKALLTVVLRGSGRGRRSRSPSEYVFIAWKVPT